MSGPAVALRRAIHAALMADVPLLAALGGPRIHDVPPNGAEFPYVTLGEAQVLDWSTATESGAEHRLTLVCWSRQGGHGEAHALAHLVQQVLHDAPLVLDGHRLVNLRASSAEIRREPGGRTYRALLRFRAVTETG
ncbi:DUF3168 domain-containing protein [Ancylobacter dichloromethanicus]|uniref:DUF3168 domain-containing protein n=1 Tax=Ancylobacter dichloromethanicus TaxID=518825 RepID=A0A9W6J540_9HYPH|nr:DUF3168 domain-containing protein [Ancylobacter dichloromethanicus]MBS7556149.1 DUF3168 domain-containing protein [Ancylobacter dichloromethanicus]GLK69903.1 hypothetical protein GCM10017643_00180 [Ancylobacter dichloromethanicus]